MSCSTSLGEQRGLAGTGRSDQVRVMPDRRDGRSDRSCRQRLRAVAEDTARRRDGRCGRQQPALRPLTPRRSGSLPWARRPGSRVPQRSTRPAKTRQPPAAVVAAGRRRPRAASSASTSHRPTPASADTRSHARPSPDGCRRLAAPIRRHTENGGSDCLRRMSLRAIKASEVDKLLEQAVRFAPRRSTSRSRSR
jgi:hypothetical protein